MRVAQLLVVVTVFGTSLAGPVVLTPRDLGDFAAVIPLGRVWEVVSDYLAYDDDVRNLLGFVHTDDFRNMIAKVDAIPEFVEFMNSLELSGYEAYKYWSILHTVLGLPVLENPNVSAKPQLTGRVLGMVGDVKALLQEDDIKRVYEEKLKMNPRFQMLVDLFHGKEFKNVIQKVAGLPEVATLLSQVGELNFDD